MVHAVNVLKIDTDTIYHALNIFVSLSGYVASITITSSPQLGVETVCDNQDVNLTCHTDRKHEDQIIWYRGQHRNSPYGHGETITVVATIKKEVYTCHVSDDVPPFGEISIIVKANGGQIMLVKMLL